MFLEKQRTLTLPMHLAQAPSFSGVRVADLLLLLCMYCFMLCFSISHVWYLSVDYILLISAKILVPLITLLSSLFSFTCIYGCKRNTKHDIQNTTILTSMARTLLGFRKCLYSLVSKRVPPITVQQC